MEQQKTKWHGKRVIAVVRQSDNKDDAGTKNQKTTDDGSSSTAAQLDNLRKIFDRLGMKYVDKIVLDGVPASAPARITAIVQQLFERKGNKNDFDAIAWQVEDRASRGGGEHGMWLEHEAKRHGLLVFYPGDEVPLGPYGSVVRVAKYEAAKEGSVSTGRRSTQGQTWAQKNGFFRTAGPTPMGCDRNIQTVRTRSLLSLSRCAEAARLCVCDLFISFYASIISQKIVEAIQGACMHIQPYLDFGGRCDEAIEFYKKALGAKVQMILRFKDMPSPGPSVPFPPSMLDKVMHATLTIGDSDVNATDGRCEGNAIFSGISLTISAANDAEADKLFTALTAGGKVTMPLGKTFFSPRFGMGTDHFGVSWMVIAQTPK